ncbi:hypothetical protein BC941DRAFT_407731 [Chlamydoabsidia padenii]|nr:hypothetical protein BC941DRAFT_407731 [Chlamydoabsidia padenii]
MTQIFPSTLKNQNVRLDKDAKSIVSTSQQTLGIMHNNHNNTYHSSTHQSQPFRRHNTSSAPPIGLYNRASCGSPSPFATTAEPARPNSTPAYYHPHLTNRRYQDDIAEDEEEEDSDIDYNSLFEAMNDSPSLNPTTNQHQYRLLQTTNGQDSFDTMLSYLRKDDELIQHMDTIEQLENISFLRVMYLGVTSAEERRLFLKKLSDGLSKTFFRQTPSALPLPHDSTSSSSTASGGTNNSNNTRLSNGFRERRHHLLPLHLFFTDTLDNSDKNGDDNGDDHAAMFEENGVSIVEADFTTDNHSTSHRPQHRHESDLVLHYIYTQCQQSHSSVSLKSILNLPPHWENQPFNGHVFSEGTPGGIDLCVYFYHDAQGGDDVIKDMELLWKINALRIPVLPIMSMSNQVQLGKQVTPTSPHSLGLSDDDDDDSHNTSYLKQRPIDVRRTELAHIFSRWRIKMMDISNLDIIGQPSFQQKGSSRQNSTQEDKMIEQRLGQAWALSSIISPTPYHILTLFQFVAMDRWAVSKLLENIMDQAEERRHTPSTSKATLTTSKDLPPSSLPIVDSTLPTSDFQHNKQHLSAHDDIKKSTTILSSSFTDILANIINNIVPTSSTNGLSSSTTSSTSLQRQEDIHHGIRLLYVLPFLFLAVYVLWVAGMMTTARPWHASLVMVSHQGEKSMTLMVNVYDGQDQPRWAPEPPQITTNLPSTLLTNKTHSLEGQYFYYIRLPRCNTLDPKLTYSIQVMSSVTRTVQGSPFNIPRYVLCDPSSSSIKSDEDTDSPIMEAWYHFRQHTRFYLRNSAKIVEMIFTEGKEKD